MTTLIHIPEKRIRKIFLVSLVLKAVGAASQIVLGVGLLLTPQLSAVILALVKSELVEDPNDFFATHISSLASHLTPGLQLFGAIYLLSHGVVKAFLIWGLVKNKLWAYPASLVVFSLFIVYQLAYISGSNWPVLGAFTLFEAFILALIWHEYRYLLRRRHESMS